MAAASERKQRKALPTESMKADRKELSAPRWRNPPSRRSCTRQATIENTPTQDTNTQYLSKFNFNFKKLKKIIFKYPLVAHLMTNWPSVSLQVPREKSRQCPLNSIKIRLTFLKF